MPPLLPILERRADIEAAIRAHQVVVVCGETGSGKSTQLPRICDAMGLARTGLIGHTQPRRIAARSVAARIAEELAVPLGSRVGYKVRFDDRTSRSTAIKVMTDGVLLAELHDDPALAAYSTIIVDEAHERSLNIDFLLGYLRTLLPRRPDLKVVVTSATIDAERFAAFFNHCPVIEVTGRLFPVEVRYLDRAAHSDDVDFDILADAVEEALSHPDGGDILAFLPGEREIRLAHDTLSRRAVPAEVLPLYSRLSSQEQDRIFHPGAMRRVILATNIAETSLTVPRIRFVVDTGLARIVRHDPDRKLQTLPIEPISQASARQRAGRCGRVAAGVCYRLYTRADFDRRPAYTDPEIRRVSLAGVILRMRALALGNVEEFPFIDPPDAAAVRDGYDTLFELGALDAPFSHGRLTTVGEQLSRLPLDPRIGRMLLAARQENVLADVIPLAAFLSIQDPRVRPAARQDEADQAHKSFHHPASDFLAALALWAAYADAADRLSPGALGAWCRERFLSPARMREWAELVAQLEGTLRDMGWDVPAGSPTAAESERRNTPIHRALLTGLLCNVACREGIGGSMEYRGVRAERLSIFPGSGLFRSAPRWIVAAEIVHTTRTYARTVAKIEPEWIEELAAHLLKRTLSDRWFDPESGVPSVYERMTMHNLVLVPRRATPLAPHDPAAARRMFIEEGLTRGAWRANLAFIEHNRAVLARARQAEARLRRRALVLDDKAIAAWFDARVPPDITDGPGLASWIAGRDDADLRLSLDDVLKPEALVAFDPARFPESIDLGDASPLPTPITCVWNPGKEDDGLTARLSVADLASVSARKAAYLIPGWRAELVHALLKQLPRPLRQALEQKSDLAQLASSLAPSLHDDSGTLAEALAAAIRAATGIDTPAAAFNPRALPQHLILRFVLTDDAGMELAAGRDLDALRERFRARAARPTSKPDAWEQGNLTDWTFPSLPASVESDRDGTPRTLYPTLIDEGDSVRLTLAEDPDLADLHLIRALRRLFALRARDEVRHYIETFPGWREATRWCSNLAPADALLDAATCLTAERVFLFSQSTPRDREAFESRCTEQWGRLALGCREVCEALHAALASRARLVQRLAAGTPRPWAASVADIREHAAYLMPANFASLLPWDRLRHYPRYAGSLAARLDRLREGGAAAESAALGTILPYWKRFTAWVARAMTEANATPPRAGARRRSLLPQTRRDAPRINLDAAEWAMQPGNLPPLMAAYRWTLEELRAAAFSGTSARLSELDALWAAATAGPRPTRA